MPDQINEIALLRAVLRDHCGSDAAARRHIEEARRLAVDPLDYCAHRFGLGNAAVWRRAALWAGFGFAERTPSRLSAAPIDRLAHLGERRTLRQDVLGRETLFIAPTFVQVLNLRSASDTIRASARFAPPDAIETGAAAGASAQLIEAAQQTTTRLWPRASAAQDLPLATRIGFAAALATIVVVVFAAGVISRPVLVPIAALLLLAPGVLRLFASLPKRARKPPILLTDSELPVYSVLIPLRDEAAMVPMLARAMAAIDYPALGSKLKSEVEVVERRSRLAIRVHPEVVNHSVLAELDCLPEGRQGQPHVRLVGITLVCAGRLSGPNDIALLQYGLERISQRAPVVLVQGKPDYDAHSEDGSRWWRDIVPRVGNRRAVRGHLVVEVDRVARRGIRFPGVGIVSKAHCLLTLAVLDEWRVFQMGEHEGALVLADVRVQRRSLGVAKLHHANLECVDLVDAGQKDRWVKRDADAVDNHRGHDLRPLDSEAVEKLAGVGVRKAAHIVGIVFRRLLVEIVSEQAPLHGGGLRMQFGGVHRAIHEPISRDGFRLFVLDQPRDLSILAVANKRAPRLRRRTHVIRQVAQGHLGFFNQSMSWISHKVRPEREGKCII